MVCMQAQLAVGSMGLPILVNVLKDDRDDLELLRGALEALVQATCSHSGATDARSNSAEVRRKADGWQ